MLSMFLFMGVLVISKAYVNIALNKPAYQQYPYMPGHDRYDASNAVDGRKSDLSREGGQCAVSGYSITATWWVNLTSIDSIHHITIYFRTDNEDSGIWLSWNAGYFLGFSVYVSNTTDKLQGTLCFKDNRFKKHAIPSVFTTNCFVHGQYIIYYNERIPGAVYPDDYESYVWGDLCEVEVYGCPATGFYGPNCSFAGPYINCQYCNIETGYSKCCKPGYKGQCCEIGCDKGSFGIECKERCGHCRDVNQCSNINGKCLTGCDAGFKGELCKTRCDKNSFGFDCKEKCGNCREIDQCFHTNGTCLTGCDDGYQGDLCKTPCLRGYFGNKCNEKCNDTCAGCNNVNGLCDSGCIPGWKGYFCNEECDKGLYGVKCNEKCGHCRDVNQCSHINGSCLIGCDAGYIGDLCKTQYR